MNSKYNKSNGTHLVDENAFDGIADFVKDTKTESTDMMVDCLADDDKLVSESKRIYAKKHDDDSEGELDETIDDIIKKNDNDHNDHNNHNNHNDHDDNHNDDNQNNEAHDHNNHSHSYDKERTQRDETRHDTDKNTKYKKDNRFSSSEETPRRNSRNKKAETDTDNNKDNNKDIKDEKKMTHEELMLEKMDILRKLADVAQA